MFRFSLAPGVPDASDLDQAPRSLVARLELASVDAPGSQGPCDEVMFDPTSVAEGIETSDDPVLLIRPAAYAVSFSRRMEP
jgi:catalase